MQKLDMYYSLLVMLKSQADSAVNACLDGEASKKRLQVFACSQNSYSVFCLNKTRRNFTSCILYHLAKNITPTWDPATFKMDKL